MYAVDFFVCAFSIMPGPVSVNTSNCCAVLCAVLCCAVLCCAVLCCAVLLCAVLCCAVLCCAALCCAMLRRAMLCCAVLCCACCVLLCLLCFADDYDGHAGTYKASLMQAFERTVKEARFGMVLVDAPNVSADDLKGYWSAGQVTAHHCCSASPRLFLHQAAADYKA